MAYKMQNITGAPEKKIKLRQCSSLRRQEEEKWGGGEEEKQKRELDTNLEESVSVSVVWYGIYGLWTKF